MQVIYKILFEVRLLHEYYLTNPDGSSIFFSASAAARDSFLLDFSNRSQRSINSDIDYIIPEPAKDLFSNYRLKLIHTWSGFKIAIAVNSTTDSGKIAYQPVAALPRDLNIPLLLVRKSADFDRYTNSRSKPPFDSIYYLSNSKSTGATARTFPFLTSAIPARSDNASYQQGELSSLAGTVSAFYIDADGAGQFAPVTGKNFLNENDRNLVTPSFRYYFLPSDNVKNASFAITTKTNAPVYDETINSPVPLQSHLVQVDERKLNTIPSTLPEDAGIYTLTVTGDNGYNRSYRILFLKAELAATGAWGLINLINLSGRTSFGIIDRKGLLIARYDTNRTPLVAPPLFEINIKSRFSFWRYINDEGKPLTDSHPAILRLTDNNLVTVTPKNHSYTPTPVEGLALPNPKLSSPIRPEGQRLFADIMVPKSDIFPSGP
jgi:hypothetical protein